jgi:hypothetical protein
MLELYFNCNARHVGQSVVVAPTGEVLMSLPRAQAGVAVFALGERSGQWFPEAV